MQKLNYEAVRAHLAKEGCELLDKSYINARTKIRYRCVCGDIATTRYDHFKEGVRCKNCGNKKGNNSHRQDYESVKHLFQEHGCVLLEETYTNTKTQMRYRCSCGNVSMTTLDRFKLGSRCRKCWKIRSCGSGNSRYNPDRESVIMNKKVRKRVLCALFRTRKSTGEDKSGHTRESLGYSAKELSSRIGGHPNWPLVRNDNWHLDHIFPIKAFIEHGITDTKMINALENLRPISNKDNLSKCYQYNEEDFILYLSLKNINLPFHQAAGPS